MFKTPQPFISYVFVYLLGTFTDLQASGFDFTKLLGDNPMEEEKVKEDNELSRQASIRSAASVEEAPKEVEEQKSSGSVGGHIYKAYFSAGGNCCVIFTLFALFVISQLFGSAADYYITYW
ncbi:hypothetical protein NQ314_020825 [Rhamnusium bicolor]|uniref:Uncharacterized protein n=1 Tax=Rhamnusium bicolor TaxID=1586634 RepID=A0AAV8WKL6_9CUCU|nr:hypothetical protein NQ314_020825 [Rhamnusium bicolor]